MKGRTKRHTHKWVDVSAEAPPGFTGIRMFRYYRCSICDEFIEKRVNEVGAGDQWRMFRNVNSETGHFT